VVTLFPDEEGIGAALLSRLDVTAVAGAEQKVDGFRASLLLKEIPGQLPQLRSVVLRMTDKLALNGGSLTNDLYAREFIKNLIARSMHELENAGDDRYALDIAGKLDLEDESTVSSLYGVAAKLYGQAGNADNAEFAQNIERAMPAFRKSAIVYMRNRGIELGEDARAATILNQRDNIIAYDRALTQCISFAHGIGGVQGPISREAMSTLFMALHRITQDSKYELTDHDAEMLQEMGVDPALLPYAIKAMGTAAALDTTAKQLFNGTATRERAKERISTMLKEVADGGAQAFVSSLMSDSRDTDSRVLAR
jgi:hypothetical protein